MAHVMRFFPVAMLGSAEIPDPPVEHPATQARAAIDTRRRTGPDTFAVPWHAARRRTVEGLPARNESSIAETPRLGRAAS